MIADKLINGRDAMEEALLYDLLITPMWREPFNIIIDDEIKLPSEGRFLDVGCGTGEYAMDLSLRGGMNTDVLAIDPSEERLEIARVKALIKKTDRVTFKQSSLIDLNINSDEFDLVIGDGSMLPVNLTGKFMSNLIRAAKPDATVAMKLTTRGSFDEIYSIYWESLYNLNLTELTPHIEAMITERLTIADAEELAKESKFNQIRAVFQNVSLFFTDADTFFTSPVIEPFLTDWFNILPDVQTKEKVKEQMSMIIDRERHDADFEVLIKATVLIGVR